MYRGRAKSKGGESALVSWPAMIENSLRWVFGVSGRPLYLLSPAAPARPATRSSLSVATMSTDNYMGGPFPPWYNLRRWGALGNSA